MGCGSSVPVANNADANKPQAPPAQQDAQKQEQQPAAPAQPQPAAEPQQPAAPAPAPAPAAAPAPAKEEDKPAATGLSATEVVSAMSPELQTFLDGLALDPEPSTDAKELILESAAFEGEIEHQRNIPEGRVLLNASELDADFGVAVSAPKNPLFAKVDKTDEKVNFMAVLPWKGAVRPPTEAPAVVNTPPNESLELEWAYGYRWQDARNNIAVAPDGDIIYPNAGLVIKLNATAEPQQQKFFLGHNDDVTCLTQHPVTPSIVASGQVATIVDRRATLPHICIWDSKTGESWKIPNAQKRAVRYLAFSPSGKLLASVGDENEQVLTIWDWKAGKKIASANSDVYPNKLFGVAWKSETELMTVGTNHAFNWTLSSGRLAKKRASVVGYTRQPFYSVAFTKMGLAAVGCHDGSVYLFVDGKCRKALKAHTGPVHSVITDAEGNGLITAGKDGRVCTWSKQLTASPTSTLNIPDGAGVRSLALDASSSRLLIGTDRAQLIQVANFGKSDAHVVTTLTQGHYDGELWALDSNPVKPTEFVTAGEDNYVAVWDAASHKLLKMGSISTKAAARKKAATGGSLTSFPPEQCSRAISYSPDGSHVAVAGSDGVVTILETAQLSQVASVDVSGEKKLNKLGSDWISAIRYSPNGKLIAVGTRDITLAIIDVENGYKKACELTHHNAAVTHLDWTLDSAYIRACDRAYELLYVKVPEDPSQASHETSGATLLRDAKWASSTVPFQWGTQGVYDPDQDGTDVNMVDISPSGTLIASGDDYGLVNIFRYPMPEHGKTRNARKSYHAHASHVMNVRWSPDGTRLFSVGGYDKAVIQWRLVTA